jgi:FkbM family methyltransferase
MQTLRHGDRFFDIGANIGMISLLSSRLVGPEGVVDAFEPNARCIARIHTLVNLNHIGNVRVHEMALAATNAWLPLSVPKYNSGEGTLTRVDERNFGPSDNIERFKVPVGVGDEALSH